MDLPKNCKFKKLAKSETLYVSGGFVSNKHWVFDMQWLLGLKRSNSLGLTTIQNAVKKAQVKATMARLNGAFYPSHDLEKVVSAIPLSQYKPAPQGGIEFIEDFLKGDYEKPGVVALAFKTKKTPYLDIEYAAALFFDTSTMIMIKDGSSPIVLQDASGKIVAALMGLNPKQYESKD